MRKLSDEDRFKIGKIISANWQQLASLPHFVTAVPGFAVTNGRLLRRPAIVVYVDQKVPQWALAERDCMPRLIEGLPIDVVVADPQIQRDAARLDAADLARAKSTKRTDYEGIKDDPIDTEYEVSKPILCSVGPDVGWTVLRDFLAETQKSLTVCMYDFSADYIEAWLADKAEANTFDVSMTLDDFRSDDEKAIQTRLEARLGDDYACEIIYCAPSRRFPNSYHPKVAVQDDARFWLSSGNWSPNSQRDNDPLSEPDQATGMYSRSNREWHVVVEDGPLAGVFQRYILHDKAMAVADAALGAIERARNPDLFVSLDDLTSATLAAARAKVSPVAPQSLPTHGKPFVVRPLLSPDNYAKRIIPWLAEAQSSLYLQFSYIYPDKLQEYREGKQMLEQMAELSWKKKFDLRIIVGKASQAHLNLFASIGFNEKSLHTQNKIHNKGIIRDEVQVLVASHNWSGDGFFNNRDAGLIIEDAEVAAYFSKVFKDDWTKRSRPAFETPQPTAILAPEGVPTPRGMVRMTWEDYYGE